MKTFICQSCRKEFQSKKACKGRTPKFCSIPCYAETLKLHKKCQLCGAEIQNKHSVSMRHRIYCSRTCQAEAKRGVPLSAEHRRSLSEGRKASDRCKGPNLYNWKGGASTLAARMKAHSHKRRSLTSLALDTSFIEALREAQ